MLAIEQVRKKIKRGKGLWGRLVTSPDGSEWIWMQLTPAALKYYQERVTCYGFIPDEGIGALVRQGPYSGKNGTRPPRRRSSHGITPVKAAPAPLSLRPFG